MTAEIPWRCFHCDDVFTDRAAAQLHFGIDEHQTPACLIKGSEGGLLKALRAAEGEVEQLLGKLHNEGGEVMLAYNRMSSRFRDTTRACEELGFQRGVDQCFDPIREALDVMREAVKECPIKRARPPIPSSCQKCGADRGDDCGLQLNAERTFGQTVMELVEGKSE